MATESIGYARLIQTYPLPARQPASFGLIDSAVNGRQTTNKGDFELTRFESGYRPSPTLVGDLQFALRYEGINLEVLALLFAGAGRAELEAWLAAKPESHFARRMGYLYEWLTGNELAAAARGAGAMM